MNILEMTGQARTHIVQVIQPRYAAQPEVITAFEKMQKAARADDIEMLPFSSFRDYKTQLRIWNKKITGQKPLYNQDGIAMDYETLSPEEIIYAILRWSTLPGASRHHWGTEIDVIDLKNIDGHYKVKLLPQEIAEDGVFYRLHQWLEKHVHKFGFFQPYKKYQGGMYAEPWHLSYFPLASKIHKQYSYKIIYDCVEKSKMRGKEQVLEELPHIYENYILNINEVANENARLL